MSKIGVVIGRFQVPILTKAHQKLLDEARKDCDQLIVLVGLNAGPLNLRNPLPFAVRYEVLNNFLTFQDSIYFILPLRDQKEDSIWVKHVDGIISSFCSMNDEVVLYDGRDGFSDTYKLYGGKFKVQKISIEDDASGTQQRQDIVYTQPTSEDANGIIYALGNIPPRIYHAVDIAVLSENRSNVLLVRKENELGWRFPGGFVDIKDTGFVCAARRELFEETGLTIEGSLEQIWQGKINDWRTSGCSDVATMSTLFVADYSFGAAMPTDDICEASWFHLDNLPLIEFEHAELVSTLLNFLKKDRNVE